MRCKNLNARYYRTNIISMILNISIFAVLFIVIAAIQQKWSYAWGALFVFVGLLPFVIYYLIQFIYYQRLTPTDIQTVKLENTYDRGKRFVGFNINIQINRRKHKVIVKPIFTRSIGSYLYVDKYIHNQANVFYNSKRNEAVVIDLVEE